MLSFAILLKHKMSEMRRVTIYVKVLRYALYHLRILTRLIFDVSCFQTPSAVIFIKRVDFKLIKNSISK